MVHLSGPTARRAEFAGPNPGWYHIRSMPESRDRLPDLETRLRWTAKNMPLTVEEIRLLPSLEARYDGFPVGTLDELAEIADVVVTATGKRHVVSSLHFDRFPDGCFLMNVGHKGDEIEEAHVAAKTLYLLVRYHDGRDDSRSPLPVLRGSWFAPSGAASHSPIGVGGRGTAGG
jgi:hypothetical protein